MSERLDTSFLDDALSFCSRESQHHVADALACHLHNTGYALQGNTAESDVEWFARNLYERQQEAMADGWDRLTQAARNEWLRIAQSVIDVLPLFQLRVAHRLIELSKVTRDIERALRKPQRNSAPAGSGDRKP